MTAALDTRQSLGEIESARSESARCPSAAVTHASDSKGIITVQVSWMTASDAMIDGNRMTGVGASQIEQAARGKT